MLGVGLRCNAFEEEEEEEISPRNKSFMLLLLLGRRCPKPGNLLTGQARL